MSTLIVLACLSALVGAPDPVQEANLTESGVMKDTTFPESVALGRKSMEDLENLRDAYKKKIDAALLSATIASNLALRLSRMEVTKLEVDLNSIRLNAISFELNKRAGAALILIKGKGVQVLTITSLYCFSEAMRLTTSFTNLNSAIAHLILNPND